MGSVKTRYLPGSLMHDPMMFDAVKVVTAYPPAIAKARWTPLRSAGGFSGARLWRGTAADGREFALKAHPPGADAGRLENVVHRWMTRATEAGLDFIPVVEPTRAGRTVVEHAGRTWDVTAWMPGRADFRGNPTDSKLDAAVTAVARLHAAWAGEHTTVPCPAVVRRWKALLAWEQLVESGWRPRIDPRDPCRSPAEAGWSSLPRAIAGIWPAILHWLHEPVPVQPCVCDLWHDHVLYDGDRVTGIIDFAAAKADHIAVDLARLLGSLIPDDATRTGKALEAYATVRPLPRPELVPFLDRTGTVVAVTNWLRWLYHARREYADRNAVAERLAGLVRRLRSLAGGSG
jgi:Ser/Thr protein kinase RdoA (MazF antagonist)